MKMRTTLLLLLLLGCADSASGPSFSSPRDMPPRDMGSTGDALMTLDMSGGDGAQTDGGPADGAAGDSGHDGAPHPDGSLADGSASDGDIPDGARRDGASSDGTAPDGTAPDGATPDGAMSDSALPDGSLPDGPQPDAAPPPARGAEWCRLQHPLDLELAAGEAETSYGRVFEPGITDQSNQTDPDLFLVGELGVASRGTPPGDGWRFVRGAANDGWDAAVANEVVNDEYQADLPGDLAPGDYHFAWRFSADGGRTWTWCDRARGFEHDGAEDGFSLDDAGTLTVR